MSKCTKSNGGSTCTACDANRLDVSSSNLLSVSTRSTKVDAAVAALIEAMAAEAPLAIPQQQQSPNGNCNHQHNDEETTMSDVWVEETLERVRAGVTSILRRRSRVQNLRPELREKIQNWLISFHRLDPRYKILTFFSLVASDGADNFVNEEDDCLLTDDPEYASKRRESSFTRVEKMLKDAFTLSSVLTVWRPCSNDAMRKMMEGSGVGKGLDIKGKSAKKGILSGFVPFLQIHVDTDKALVSKIGRKAKMRVYYQSREARDEVLEELEPFGNDYMEFDPHKVIPSEMIELDQYANRGYYGIELYQRLFWQAYVVVRDIERSDGTATGRPSVPGFQDANLKTLKVATDATPKPSPMPVVFQHHTEDPMNPQHLLMAYEENGTVTPVVSDFDGFLLGWRREALWFGCNLPRDQEDLMLWCVDRIEEILDSPNADSWTVRWLDVLKENNPDPEFPPYGFGDPKSYGIMERAALQLIDTGAVRHGSECFNYYFPQEMDDTLLIVSDTLKPVPWKYVGVKQLQSILSQRIWDGFVFPINPKWILCDPGWKRLYDQLMASDALYAEYTKDVWYPPFSGIREKIDKISAKHPKGFQRKEEEQPSPEKPQRNGFLEPETSQQRVRRTLAIGEGMSGSAAHDLAELELDKFNARRRRRQSQQLQNNAELQQALASFQENIDELSDLDTDDGDDL